MVISGLLPGALLLTLHCYCLGQNPHHGIFSVRIDWSADINKLKEVIKRTRSQFRNILANELNLWKTSIPVNAEETLKSLNPIPGEDLESEIILKDIFPESPSEYDIHILVECPNKPLNPFKRERYSCLKDLRAHLSESSTASELTSMIPYYVLTKDRIACHRPETIGITPIALLDPVFAKLEDDMQSLQPTREDYAFARKLSDQMSQFYGEETHIALLQDLFKEHGLIIHHQDEDMMVSAMNGDCHHDSLKLVLIGMNSELNMNHDSFFQVLLQYVKNLIRTYDTVPRLRNARLPSILLFCNGPFLGVAGALFTSKVQCELMGLVLPLFWNESSNIFCHKLARALGSIRNAMNELKTRYHQSEPLPSELRLNDYPYITSYQVDGSNYSFTYDEDQPYSGFQEDGFVHGDIRGANLLVGREEGNGELVFKMIDFDWAGKVGCTHYPSRLHSGIARASDVVACGPIEFEHDNFMVNQLSYLTDEAKD
ncbi:hypothetical protein AMATHDRAFT_50596 [Amanita thiersii Skay4041]|uniref:Crinkler effector protein N-terminal domain-containing protein n=1 Tax=Amanita thiersii Skay4041 TaxID=703135 RepID=A0A2A9N8G7_9AGAR|nr:hypothetical protein AMATHDRAFT_50596 [Amanita thiersii Skay4041]